MKTYNKIIGFGMTAGLILAMASCAQEEIFQPSAAGIPQASDYQIGISVDELNNVELNILDKNGQPAKGVYPIWYFDNSQRPSTALTYRNLVTIAGEYPVEMKVGNANGVSEGSVNATVTISQTIFDFAPYMRALTGGSTKEWSVNGEEQGHMGCGPDASSPSGWWSAAPNDKLAEGVYDNILVFGDTGQEKTGMYVFDPGTSGTFYVNKDVNGLPGFEVNNPNDGNDFRVSSGVVETSFTLSPEGANLYLTLPADTPFPYVPSEGAFANPKYRVINCTSKSVTLAQDLDGISWQYIIAPHVDGTGSADVTTTGFKYDFEHNLWKNANVFVASTWFADGGWGELANQPEVTVTDTKGIKLQVPAETGGDQWQGQVHVGTDIEVFADKTYDFSCNVKLPVDGKVTVKVQKTGDDDTYFVADRVDVAPDGQIVWFADMKGFDGTLKIAFDFGGLAGCEVEVSDIVFKEHQYDDGTVIPAAALAPTISDADNLFADFEVVKYSTWFADGGWGELANQPEISFFPGGYEFTVPEGMGGDQWQGQVHVWTNVACSAENKYDFMLTIEADQDVNQITVKIQKGDSLGDDANTDDNVAFGVDRVNVEAGVPYLYFFKDKQGFDTSNIQVCMDYAGAPAGTNIKVSDIRMQIAK